MKNQTDFLIEQQFQQMRRLLDQQRRDTNEAIRLARWDCAGFCVVLIVMTVVVVGFLS